jgi:4-hydroxy-tetrahydrodipicolinate reductase
VPTRVIQWSTGNVGYHALRSIIRHPELELAGVWVHSPDKVGRDAGDLAGLGPTGVVATDDVDALLALDAECVCYTATADLRPEEALQDLCRILEAGMNVVSTSIVPLVHPRGGDAAVQAMVDRLEAACQAGGTSCFTSGIDPGFANDLLPITLLGVCERVDEVRIQEILNYATYEQPEVLFHTMGFGQPLDRTPLLLIPGVLGFAWGGVIRMIAEAVGAEVEETREVFERATLDRDIVLPFGTVEAGTQAGLRFEVQGIVDGEPKIIAEHVTRLDDAVAPEWPSQGGGQGLYRILVKGSPSLDCRLEIESEDGDHNTGGLVVTAMRVLNAVPAVCAAPPGVLSALDLPILGGRGSMHQTARP